MGEHTSFVFSCAFSPCGKLLVTGSNDRTAKGWSTSSWSLVRTLEGYSGPVHSCAFSPDGTLLATGSAKQAFVKMSLDSTELLPQGSLGDSTAILWGILNP